MNDYKFEIGQWVRVIGAQKDLMFMESEIGKIHQISTRISRAKFGGEETNGYRFSDYGYYWAEEWLTDDLGDESVSITEQDFESIFD